MGSSNDFDIDGMPNDYEDLFGLNKFSNDANGDLDNDGLTNIEEFNRGTIPNNPDTDGDDILDDVDNNPLHPEESPPTVMIASPQDGQTLVEGATIQFSVDATDDGLLTSVQLSTDTGLVESLASPPFVVPFEVPAGVSQIVFTAAATDSVPNTSTATATVNVIPDPLTTVIGTVVDADGASVEGATVMTVGDLMTTTGANGSFSIPNVQTVFGEVSVRATAVDGDGKTLAGSSQRVAPVLAGVTDVGAITIRGNTTLYSVSSQDDQLRILDPTGSPVSGDIPVISSMPITLADATVEGGNGLATHPQTGELWAILKISENRRQRELVTIDPSTGVATRIGNTGAVFASLAFDPTGRLFGVTGDGEDTLMPESLYELSTTDATPTFVVAFGRGSDGEAIGFNPADGLLYHASGHSGNLDVIFESLNLGTLTLTDIDITDSLLIDEEAQALTFWEAEGVFLWKQDHGAGPLFRVTPDGIPTLIGNLNHQAKGLTFGPSP